MDQSASYLHHADEARVGDAHAVEGDGVVARRVLERLADLDAAVGAEVEDHHGVAVLDGAERPVLRGSERVSERE